MYLTFLLVNLIDFFLFLSQMRQTKIDKPVKYHYIQGVPENMRYNDFLYFIYAHLKKHPASIKGFNKIQLISHQFDIFLLEKKNTLYPF